MSPSPVFVAPIIADISDDDFADPLDFLNAKPSDKPSDKQADSGASRPPPSVTAPVQRFAPPAAPVGRATTPKPSAFAAFVQAPSAASRPNTSPPVSTSPAVEPTHAATLKSATPEPVNLPSAPAAAPVVQGGLSKGGPANPAPPDFSEHDLVGPDLGADVSDFAPELGRVPVAGPRDTSARPEPSSVKLAEPGPDAARRAGSTVATKAGGMPHTPAPSAFAAIAQKSTPEPAQGGKVYESASLSASPFSKFTKPGDSAPEKSARRDMNAVKLVTRLVQGIVFKPGTTAPGNVKSAELKQMLVDVNRGATIIAVAAAPLDAHRPWVHAMCSEAVAELVATRNEQDRFGEPVDVDKAAHAVAKVFESTETDAVLAQIIDGLSESRYVEATTEQVAADRVSVSLAAATWDLFGQVNHWRLGVGDQRYTYGREASLIVGLLASEALRIARDLAIRIGSLDMRTAHLQGSIRRAAGLLGAEYVNRTRQIMNWISEEGISEEEYAQRVAEADRVLESAVIPEICELARRNFAAIEQLAPKLLEESKHAAHEDTPRQAAL